MCSILTPPLIFIGGSHSQQGCLLRLFLQEPTSTTNERLPCRRSKAVGPMGLSAGPPKAPTAPNCWGLGLSRPPPVLTPRLGLSSVDLLQLRVYRLSVRSNTNNSIKCNIFPCQVHRLNTATPITKILLNILR